MAVVQVAVGESVQVEESLGGYEALRVFFDVAAERGHDGPSVVVDERGKVLTHPDYVDRMGAAHSAAGTWAFCRRPAAEAFGPLGGTDRVRDHALHLAFEPGSPYSTVPHLHDQLYLQHFGSSEPHLQLPVCTAHPVAWNNEGSRICLLEERLGDDAGTSRSARYLLWEYEPALGRRRPVAAFPAESRLDFVELTYSVDDLWIHLCEWRSGRNLLIRVSDGTVIPLPVRSGAMSWNPHLGVNAMVAMVPDTGTGRLVISDYDLATGALSRRSELESPTGPPLTIRELSMSRDGTSALVTAPIGATGIERTARGGVHIAAVVDIDDGSIEPILPVAFRTQGAQRRHTSPRWCEERTRDASSTVTPCDRLLAGAQEMTCADDTGPILDDQLKRWTEVLDGIQNAWDAGRIPRARFAEEYVQYALSCYDLDEAAADEIVSRARDRARTDVVSRGVIRAIDTSRQRGRRVLPQSFHGQAEENTTRAGFGTASDSSTLAGEIAEVQAAADRLISAETVDDAFSAARELRCAGRLRDATDEQSWTALAALTSDALAERHYVFAAKAGLATMLWHDFYLPNTPELTTSRLSAASDTASIAILLNCFEACTHLHERTVLGADGQGTFDAEEVRGRCQSVLSHVPADRYLSVGRRAGGPETPAPAVPDPAHEDPVATGRHTSTRAPETHAADADTLAIRHRRAQEALFACEPAEALDLACGVLRERTALLGGSHEDTVATRVLAGWASYFLGRYDESHAHAREAVDALTGTLGPDDPSTLAAEELLGWVLCGQKRPAEAIPAAERLADARERSLGADHVETLAARHLQATALQAAGDHAAALRLARSTADARVFRLGPEHADTLESQHLLAVALHSAGQPRKAMNVIRDVLAVRRRLNGEDHPDTLDSLVVLGIILRDHKPRNALEPAIAAADGRARLFGPDDERTREAEELVDMIMERLDEG